MKSSSKALLRERFLVTATAGVAQNRPRLMPDVAKRAALDATARSQLATSWQPAAVATPCTRAITGCGSAGSACIIAAQRANSSRCQAGSGRARISRRSWPAQNARPAPASTSTRTLGSAAIEASAPLSSSINASESELNWSGRSSVSVVTPSQSLRIREEAAAGIVHLERSPRAKVHAPLSAGRRPCHTAPKKG